MTTLLYSLSFIPILLITLTVHELGHLFFARWAGLKTSGFQIGAAWKICRFHTGNTRIRLDESTRNLHPQVAFAGPGDLVFVFVSRDHQGGLRADAIMHDNKGLRLEPDELEAVRYLNGNRMRLAGRVRETGPEHLVLADMEWSLRALPLMAGVHLPEDPTRTIPEAYNNTPWRNKFAITLAGPMANIWLMVMTILVLAIFPITGINGIQYEITGVETNSPAAVAGIMPGDRPVRVQNSLRVTPERIREEIDRAQTRNRAMDLEVRRNGKTLRMQIHPEAGRTTIGIRMGPVTGARPNHSLHPNSIADRFTSIGQVYFRSLRDLAVSINEEQDQGPVITGPIMGAYETAQAIDYVGPKAWIITLATINLGVAILNLIPFPPLDGFRIAMESAQALRKGEPVNPRVEQVLVLGGMSLIWMAGIYLIMNDLIRLLR